MLNTNKQLEIKKLGFKEYIKALEIQNHYHDEICNIKLSNRKNNRSIPTPNYLLFVEHNHVYTIGKSGDISNLLLNKNQLKEKKIDFYKINRGGDITYHGPGQIMGYPILDLDNFFTDINLYLRNLENTIIDTLKHYEIDGFTIKGETGVWVKKDNDYKKICAFGIRASRWVTMHGFSLNVQPDLNNFKYIIPCGISDKGITSISDMKKETINISDLKLNLIENFARNFKAEIEKND